MNAALPTRLEKLLETLEGASDPSELQSVIEALRNQFNVDHMVYHWVSAGGEQYGCGTYSPHWVQRYVEKDYLRIDPVIQGCYQCFQPVNWKELDWSGKSVRAFRQEAIKFGVGNQGYSIPVRGPNAQFALFTVSHNCDDRAWNVFTGGNQRALILIAHFFNQKALEFEPERQQILAQQLSPREADSLTLLALGYSRAQVAEALSISEHTLRVYIESARFKLGAINTVHAVARALNQGLIVI